ncbi:non-specific lipid-transfer protein 1-like [Bidens hawaiensis]|uniref:non-specific lipid-transfer protein 1-like n=1 Tax=Bidens hawaiensis TaxID=980011 RepID=UPI00404B7C64
MAGGPKASLAAVLIAIMAAATIPRSMETGVTCKLVVSSLTPCTTYLIRGGQVPTKCCNGVKLLYKDADTKPDREMACRCMEQASKLLPGIKVKYAGELPEKCDVHIPYEITPTFNCSTVE